MSSRANIGRVRSFRPTATLASILLAGLPVIGCAPNDAREPMAAPRVGPPAPTASALPSSVASLSRSRTLIFDSDKVDFAVDYVVDEVDLSMVATVYWYDRIDRGTTLDAQFRAEQWLVETSHENVRLLDLLVDQEGPETVMRAHYRYHGLFSGEPRDLVSVLVLTQVQGLFVKLRATAPYEQSERAIRAASTLFLTVPRSSLAQGR